MNLSIAEIVIPFKEREKKTNSLKLFGNVSNPETLNMMIMMYEDDDDVDDDFTSIFRFEI